MKAKFILMLVMLILFFTGCASTDTPTNIQKSATPPSLGIVDVPLPFATRPPEIMPAPSMYVVQAKANAYEIDE